MKKQPHPRFSPYSGEKVLFSSPVEEWRENGQPWPFDPWTGKLRDRRDVESDPFGLAIWHKEWGALPVAKPTDPVKPALERQEGGGHYKVMKIQPFEYIHANGLGFAEGCVVKYVSRWRAKGGIEDLKKARHFLDLLIEAEHSAQDPSKC